MVADDLPKGRDAARSDDDVANLGLVRPPLVFLTSILLGLVLHAARPVQLAPGGWATPVGAVLVLLAIVLFVTAVRTLRGAGTPVPGNRPTTTIVRAGPYRFTRNPIYLAFSLFQLGLALLVNSAWLLVTLVAAFALMALLVVPREERYLERRFPAEYASYARSVRRWFLVIVCAVVPASQSAFAQLAVDSANRYANVGAVMIWRVNESGTPVQLLAFVSGTLIRDRVMVTAGHFTAPVKALGGMPPMRRAFASFSPLNARDRSTWIPVTGMATHPSMPRCPPPPQCDPTDDILVTPLEPGIADVGLVFLASTPRGVQPARLAPPGALDKAEGRNTTIVGYGTIVPRRRDSPPDTTTWDGKRRIRTSAVRRVVDETWALWSIPSYVCSGDSGGGIFLNDAALVANVSDGGRDCRRQNNNNRLDTRGIQQWIAETVRQHLPR